MSIFQKDKVTLNELKSYLAVLDIQDGEMVADIETVANGTYPREGADVDKNGEEYRWHNFLVCDGETYDALKEEFGEDTKIDWDTLYDAGITSSQFERDLNREIPRGAKATVTAQRVGDEINVMTHELHIKNAAVADRFADHKQDGRNINAGATNGEMEAETETA